MNLQISPLDKLNGFLERLDGFKKSKVSLIKSGHNREIFLIEVAKKKYVAYVGHHKNDGGSSVKNEALVLSFLGSKGIDFVPKFVHYSNQLNILIVVFIPGKHIDFKSISDQDVYIFAKQLVLFHQISIKEFNTFCTID